MFFGHASTLLNFEYKTDERLSYFEMSEKDILSIIKILNTTKPQEWDTSWSNYEVTQLLFH